MDKPVSVLRREFVETLVSQVNNSGLPTYVVIPILENALQEIKRIDEELYQKDLASWEQSNEPVVEVEEEADDGRIPDDQGT